jgi:two-component system response regulator NreC
MEITLVLADDHPIVRRGVRNLLETEPGFTIIGEACDGLAAVEMVEQLKPQVLLVDLMMPGLPGLEVVRQLKQQVPQTRCIIFSMYSSDTYIHEAFGNGAWGYLLKGDDADEMIRAVRTVAEGQRYLCPAVSARVIAAYAERAETFIERDAYDDLSAREREVLQLVAEGETNTTVAERLFISSRTVEVHRANAMRKLNLRTQSDLVRYALRRGLISLE